MSKSIFLLLWIVGCASLAFAHDQGDSRQSEGLNLVAKDVTIEQRLNGQLPLDLVFRDEDGREVALSQYFDGKPVLLALVYYECPQLCPLVLDGLARSLRPLDFKAGEEYRVIAISIDPRETPELARSKKRVLLGRLRPEAADGWHLLTGNQLSIDSLAEAVGFRYLEYENNTNRADRYRHAIGTIVITPKGIISRYFYGFDYPPRDLRLALLEASGNRIGSPVDQLLLLCYKYDPATGKYTLAILNILRISGAASAFALGGFLLIMVKRERRNASVRAKRQWEAR
jgi:protein SCO1